MSLLYDCSSGWTVAVCQHIPRFSVTYLRQTPDLASAQRSLVSTGEPLGAVLAQLGDALAGVHAFYDTIGGLPGYQRRCLQMIADGRAASAAAGAGAADAGSSSAGDR